jgi:hypothetical protein
MQDGNRLTPYYHESEGGTGFHHYIPERHPGGAPPGYLYPNPPSPPRTPTGDHLHHLTTLPDQMFATPQRHSGSRPMTHGEYESFSAYRQNLDNFDPNGQLRRQGETFQTFRPGQNGPIANIPIHYERGGAVDHPPPNSFRPGTDQIIHSHYGSGSEQVSSHDYYEAWKSSKTTHAQGEMMYDARTDRLYGYQGTHPPTFQRLTTPEGRPSPFERHGSPGSESSGSSTSSGSIPTTPSGGWPSP